MIFSFLYDIVIHDVKESGSMTDELLRYVKQSDLDKGIKYDNRKVRYVGSYQDLGYTTNRFIVSSEHTLKSYIVSVEVDSDNKEISDITCTCPQFALTDSCKHVAAVLTKFQGEYFLFDEEEHNSILASALLNELKKTSLDKNIIKKEARIVPYLKFESYYNYYSYYDNEAYELRFKVGANKLYMLGNKVSTFIDRYRNGGEVKFGKEIVFSNKEYYFNSESKRLIDFIELAYSRQYRYDAYLFPTKSVLDDFGFNTSKVHNLACPAFEFEPESIENIRPLLKDTPLEKKEKPVVGFVLCGWNMLKGPFNRLDWTDDEFSPFKILLEDLIEKFNVDICLLSHSNGFDVSPEFKLKRGRDYPMVERLYDLLNHGSYSSNVYLFDGIYSPAQTKAIIGQFDVLISGRVHAAVAALSQSVPTMIIDYGHEPKAHKLKGFAKVAEVEDYVADPHSLENMINVAHQVFEQRIVIREKLAERNVKIKSMIRENFNLLHSIVALK